MTDQEIHRLIYGKNNLDRIVSVEVNDDHVEVFRELPSMEVESFTLPNQFWVLCDRNPGGWNRLKGSLHYKWGKQFVSREEFMAVRSQLAKRKYDCFSIYDSKESFLVKDGLTYFKDMKVEDVSVLSFDIEATSLSPDDPTALVLIIANTLKVGSIITRRMFAYDEYAHEGEMIGAWCDWVRSVNPSIICGHNVFSYDFPYLAGRAKVYDKELLLGRDDSPVRFDKYESKFRKDQTQDLHYKRCRIYGREIVDTLFLAIKHDMADKRYESYALKKIIAFEGWEVPGRVFYDADNIRHDFLDPEKWKQIKLYAMFDADDALTLFDKMVPAQFYFAQSVPKSFQLVVESATGSQLNSILLRAYLQQGHSIPAASEIQHFRAAISFGNPGLYHNVFKVDVQSEYPSIILQYELYDPDKDPEAYFLRMVDFFTQERFKNKRIAKETGDPYYKGLEQSQKIGINSAYGMCGAVGLNFNSLEIASFITEKGRECVKRAIYWATGAEYVDTVETDA